MTTKELLISDVTRFRRMTGRGESNPNGLQVVFTCLSPRLIPVVLYRVSHGFNRKRISLLGKLFSLINFFVFGIEISAEISIGPGLFFPHTQGTVVGARKIGANATIFQQVTFGAKELDMGFNPNLRPVIGDNVVVGAGAKVLGGISVGDRVTIGANSVVLSDIPSDSVCVGIPAKVVNREK